MAFCTNCGNRIPDNVKFCTSCCTSVAEDRATVLSVQSVSQPVQPCVQPQLQAAQQPAPVYAAPPAQTYKEEPITTGGYIGIMFLMLIPLINLILLIIWACGGCRKVNKRNFARAMLVWLLITGILATLFILVGGLLFGDTINAIKEFGISITDIN